MPAGPRKQIVRPAADDQLHATYDHIHNEQQLAVRTPALSNAAELYEEQWQSKVHDGGRDPGSVAVRQAVLHNEFLIQGEEHANQQKAESDMHKEWYDEEVQWVRKEWCEVVAINRYGICWQEGTNAESWLHFPADPAKQSEQQCCRVEWHFDGRPLQQPSIALIHNTYPPVADDERYFQPTDKETVAKALADLCALAEVLWHATWRIKQIGSAALAIDPGR